MRKETVLLTEANVMRAIGGQLFDQAPNRAPRKAEIIMSKLKEAFRQNAINENEWFYYRIERNEVYNFIKSILLSIPEFEELNLSQIEFENGINVHDENRSKYKFTSRYDKETTESWKRDFIDLHAFIRNAVGNINIDDDDCFLCVHKGTVKCDNCLNREDLKNNYKCITEIKGKYTMACKHTCHQGKYICCEECDKKDSCSHNCVSCRRTCGQVRYKGIKIYADNQYKISFDTLEEYKDFETKIETLKKLYLSENKKDRDNASDMQHELFDVLRRGAETNKVIGAIVPRDNNFVFVDFDIISDGINRYSIKIDRELHKPYIEIYKVKAIVTAALSITEGNEYEVVGYKNENDETLFEIIDDTNSRIFIPSNHFIQKDQI